ncbi:hypothetical protein G6F65_022637 [Rhizopus arrhizus]|nr:hypothetical protein G6F65_022637 [Rhizopus arrhizus]
MPDRARAEIHARHFAHVGVVTQGAAQPGIAIQQFAVDETVVGQHREQPHGGMALAHQEAVAVGPVGLARAQPHHVVIQRREDFRAREDRAVVPDLRDFDESDCLQPDMAGFLPQHPDFPLGGGLLVMAHGASFLR